MARQPAPSDFTVTVDDIGKFIFARRTLRDEMRIEAEYSKYLDGVETPTAFLAMTARTIATISVLIVTGPEGFTREELLDQDSLEPKNYVTLGTVYKALTEKESSFRPKPAVAVEAGSADAVQDGGVLVSSQVQPTAV